MKDNHHITQNQTVKININNSGSKTNKKRSKPRRVLGGIGATGGSGGGNFGGGFSVPPIIHNDNKPDVSNLENSLQKIYDNQMTQHTYSNYLRDEYASHPRIEPAHYTYNLIGNGEHNLPFTGHQRGIALPIVEDRYESDSDGEDSTPPLSPNTVGTLTAPPTPAAPAPAIPNLNLGTPASASAPPPAAAAPAPSPAAVAAPTPAAKKYRERKNRDDMEKHAILARINRDIPFIDHYNGGDKEKHLRNIRGDIQVLKERTGRDYTYLLPEKYH